MKEEELQALKKRYRIIMGIVHPDHRPPHQREIATRITAIINQAYNKLVRKMKNDKLPR